MFNNRPSETVLEKESPTTVDELRDIALQARTYRLAGAIHDGIDAPEPLVGYSFDNCYVLYNLLEFYHCEPTLVEGTTTPVAEETFEVPADIRDMEKTEELGGYIDHWIEIDHPHPDDDTTLIVDIASEPENGDIIIVSNHADYFEVANSKEKGEELIEYVRNKGHRCPYCSTHQKKKGGCPNCLGTDRSLRSVATP